MKNGLKFDGEKIDLSLMPPEWIYAFSELFAAGHSPALRSGEISEEQRQRNVDGVKALVAGVLGR